MATNKPWGGRFQENSSLAANEFGASISFDQLMANEDIHMNIEALLAKEIGSVAGKLHTARSRNNQVTIDFHLYLKKRLPKVIHEIKHLQNVLVTKNQKHLEAIMPSYTHLQHAQPIDLLWTLFNGLLFHVSTRCGTV